MSHKDNGMLPRPECCTEEHLLYLDQLRESGETNMFGAAPYLRGAFGLSRQDASIVLVYWMHSFSTRHGIGEQT